MINMIFNRKSKKVGKAVIIKPDSDTIGADYNELKGAIIGIINTQDNEDVYIVRLNNAPIIDGDFTVTDILLGGIGMNLGDELFGKPKQPQGLPVLIYMYRVKNPYTIPEKILRPPPATEFLGRGKIRLANRD